MEKISSFVGRFIREEDGAAASEYAVLVALIVVAVAAAVSLFNLDGIYEVVSGKVVGCVNSANGTC